jgi:hypothetical protein
LTSFGNQNTDNCFAVKASAWGYWTTKLFVASRILILILQKSF